MQLTPTCPNLLKDAICKFLTVLNETEPQFIAELTIQQLRKTILELIQRIPLNDHRSYTKEILLSIYSLVEKGLMFQMNKNLLNQDIPDVILLISNLIALQPTDEQKSNPNNKEIYRNFIAAQVKSLSILAYFMKSHKVTSSNLTI